MANTIVTIIFQISDATPKLDCSLGYLTPLIFSCLVLVVYLFFDFSILFGGLHSPYEFFHCYFELCTAEMEIN